MPQTRGYLVIQEYGSVTKIEIDTITCSHCQRVILLHDREGSIIEECAGFCRVCMSTICLDCNKTLLTKGCETWLARCDRVEGIRPRGRRGL